MNIILKVLETHNFMSFGDASLMLDNRGYVLVNGINNNKNDAAQSNGSGKSALFEAIIYALTGETSRGTKDVVNLYGDGDCGVELYFDVDDVPYCVFRGKKSSKSYLQLFVNGEDKTAKGVRDTEKALKDYLPDIDAGMLGAVVILGQGLPQRFSNNTPSGRKEILEKLSKSDFMLEDIKARIASRKDTLSSRSSELQAVEKSLKDRLDLLTEQLNQQYAIKDSIKNSENQNAKLAYIETQIKTLDDQISVAELRVDDNTCSINEAKDEIETLTSQLLHDKATLKEKIDKELEPLSEQQVALSAKELALQEQLRAIDSIVDVCPTCGQRIIGVQKPNKEPILTRCYEIGQTLDEVIAKIKSLNDDLRIGTDQLTRSWESKVGKIKSYIELTNSKIKTDRGNLAQWRNCLYDLQSEKAQVNAAIATMETRLMDANDKIKSLEDSTNQLSNELLYNSSELSNVGDRISVINKINTFVTRDFRGILLGGVIDCINKAASEYSSELFDDKQIHLELDGNNLDIYFGDRVYESLSTGERLKCDIVIQLSLRSMLCEYLGFSCNIIVLDELFDGLDKLGCEKVLKLLFDGLSDISTTFIITHRADLPITCDSNIIVEKDESGVSHIQ